MRFDQMVMQFQANGILLGDRCQYTRIDAERLTMSLTISVNLETNMFIALNA